MSWEGRGRQVKTRMGFIFPTMAAWPKLCSLYPCLEEAVWWRTDEHVYARLLFVGWGVGGVHNVHCLGCPSSAIVSCQRLSHLNENPTWGKRDV